MPGVLPASLTWLLVTELNHDVIRTAETPNDDRMRGWWETVRLGFHDTRGTDETFELWRRWTVADEGVLRAAYAPGRGHGLPADWPVGTLYAAPGSINAGKDPVKATLITDVTVRPTHRRRGILRTMMTAQLTEAREAGVPLAALTASDARIYGRFGFGMSTVQNILEVDTRGFELRHQPAGTVEFADPWQLGEVYDDLNARFHQWMPGSVGRLGFHRPLDTGEVTDEGKPNQHRRAALHYDTDGTIDGMVLFNIDEGGKFSERTATIVDIIFTTWEAYLALWSFLGSMELVLSVSWRRGPVADPLPWAMTDSRGYTVKGRKDFVWTRVLDPIAAFTERGFDRTGQTVIEVADPMGFAEGRFRIDATADGAEVTPTSEEPDATLDPEALGSLYLGGVQTRELAAAGRVRGSDDGIDRLAQVMDTERTPYNQASF